MVEICSFRQSWAHIVFARNQALGTCGLNFVFGLRFKVKLTNGEHAAPVLKEQMRSWWRAGNRSDRRGITWHYSTLVHLRPDPIERDSQAVGHLQKHRTVLAPLGNHKPSLS